MEDERIARTILSALLQKNVVAVQTRRNEYSNIARDGLSVFRIDFGATIEESDGTRHLILIELQKTWLETETLRFRQYLGAQYANVENMLPDNQGAYAIPMVTVYLLGHKVGNIEEPVLYVRRQTYDYNHRLVTKGLPDPFVDSLTHDSIIVQIPLLHGQINNRLDKVLSVFDQSRAEVHNKHMLNIDDSAYEGDADMLLIVNRLMAAASDAKMRHDMNVEDEFFSVIEKRDTTIMLKDRKIAEQNTQIAEQITQIAEKNTQIAEQNTQIAEQNSQIAEQNSQIAEKNSQIAEKNSQIAEKNSQIAEKNSQIAEQRATIQTSVKMLYQAGMSVESIAVNLHLDVEEVNRMIAE
jgi:hypothetical protein